MITWECKIGKEKVFTTNCRCIRFVFQTDSRGRHNVHVPQYIPLKSRHCQLANGCQSWCWNARSPYYQFILRKIDSSHELFLFLFLVKGCIIFTVASHPGQISVVYILLLFILSLYTTSWVIVLATYQHLPEPLISWLFCANGFLWPYPYRAP